MDKITLSSKINGRGSSYEPERSAIGDAINTEDGELKYTIVARFRSLIPKDTFNQ